MSIDWSIIVNLFAALGSVSAIVATLLEKRKRDAEAHRADSESAKAQADAAESLSDTSVKLIAPMKAQLEAMTEELAAQRAEMKSMRRQLDLRDTEVAELKRQLNITRATQARHENGIRQLAEQVKALGGQPVYDLPEPA